MKLHLMVGSVAAMTVALCGGPIRLHGQAPSAVDGHIAKARAASGSVY